MAYPKNSAPIEAPKGIVVCKNYAYHETFCYDKEKRQARPKMVCVGKTVDKEKKLFLPNSNYFAMFDTALAEPPAGGRSDCLQAGPCYVMSSVADSLGLPDILARSFAGGSSEPGEQDRKDACLALDLAFFMIRSEEADMQHAHAYSLDNATLGFIPSDSEISAYLKKAERVSGEFLRLWGERMRAEHGEKVYVCYDSSNFNSVSVGVALVEEGYAKDDKDKPQINFEIVVKAEDGMPLLYREYPGSITDVAECESLVAILNALGYTDITFICDRGYILKKNMLAMKEKGFHYVLMMKDNLLGFKSVVAEHGAEVKERADAYLEGHDVFGKSFECDVFHDVRCSVCLYYTGEVPSSDRRSLFARISEEERELKELLEAKGRLPVPPSRMEETYGRHFSLWFSKDGKGATVLKGYSRDNGKIDRELQSLGFFSIATDTGMTPAEVLDKYRLRDRAEKVFMYIKTGMAMRTLGTHSDETTAGKLFIAFLATIVRSVLVSKTSAKRQAAKDSKGYTVRALLDELGKIKVYRKDADSPYRRRYVLTSRQKTMLGLFGLSPDEKEVSRGIDRLLGQQLPKSQEKAGNGQKPKKKQAQAVKTGSR